MAAKTKKTEKEKPFGRPTTLTEELAQAIIKDVRDIMSIAHAAELHRVPRSTIQTWLAKGKDEIKEGLNTIFTDFTTGIYQARAQFVAESINELKIGNKNWQSNSWLLERCCAEDFGKDSELYRQLLEDYKMLMQSLIDQNKGVNHGS